MEIPEETSSQEGQDQMANKESLENLGRQAQKDCLEHQEGMGYQEQKVKKVGKNLGLTNFVTMVGKN